MQIQYSIENCQGRYRVQIATTKFSALEEQKLAEFGEPTVDIGSEISGSASRVGETNTTATISPVSGGSGATCTVSVNASGQVIAVAVTNGGSGYSSGATIAFAGDGTGATGTVTVVGGAVTSVSVTAPGTGYSSVPHNVDIILPPTLRRLKSDFPAVQIFDLADYPDADVIAKVYANVLIDRLTEAKNNLIASNSQFEGEFLTTV